MRVKLDRQVVSKSSTDKTIEIMASAPHPRMKLVHIKKTVYIMKVKNADHASANKIKEEGIYFKLYDTPWQTEFKNSHQ